MVCLIAGCHAPEKTTSKQKTSLPQKRTKEQKDSMLVAEKVVKWKELIAKTEKKAKKDTLSFENLLWLCYCRREIPNYLVKTHTSFLKDLPMRNDYEFNEGYISPISSDSIYYLHMNATAINYIS